MCFELLEVATVLPSVGRGDSFGIGTSEVRARAKGADGRKSIYIYIYI